MAWASTAPAAIAGLVAVLAASPDLAGVGLRDGPRVVADGATEVVTVGFTDEDNPAVVDGSMTYEGLAVAPLRETYSVRCAAVVRRGSGDITDARGRAYELLAAVGGVLAADKTLGGVALSARVGDVTLSQDQTSKGAAATVAFSVDVDAYTTR